MMLRLVLLLTALTTASAASAQTVLSGMVGDGTTVGGDVRLGDARVPAGATLRIEPGAALLLTPESRLAVEGVLVVGGDAARPVVLRGSSPEAVVRLGAGGSGRFDGVRIEAEHIGALVAADGDLDVEMHTVEVAGGRFGSLVRGALKGRVALDGVRIVGASFGAPVVDARGASLVGMRVLLADADVAQTVFRAASVHLAFSTLAELRGTPTLTLVDAPVLRIETSVVWPGIAYVVAGPEAEMVLTESVVEGAWSEFLGVLTRSSGDGRRLFELHHDAPVFADDGSYRLASGTYGADRLPMRQAADADGSRADLGAYGGGGRRPRSTYVTVGMQTTLTEAAALPQQEGVRQSGGGVGVSVLQEVTHRASVRVGGRVYEADVAQNGLASGRVAYATGEASLVGQLRLVGPISVEGGPQLLVHRWTYTRAANETRGVFWRLGATVGAYAALARGVGVRAGLDLPVYPAFWNDYLDIPSAFASGQPVTRRVFVPRVHLGVSVRVR